jgi:branched-chain amino acid transport system substrate-binding protein
MTNIKLGQRISVTWIAACAFAGFSGFASAQEATVNIGFSGPLTGASADYGKDLQRGAALAIDEANAKKLTIGGKPVTLALLVQDDQGDPKIAVQVAQRLADLNVAAVVGHMNSGTTIAASSVYNRASIPLIVPAASNPALTHQGFKFVFRPYGTDDTVASAAADYAVKTLHAKRIAVVDDRTAYGQNLAAEFEKYVKTVGGSLVSHEYTNDQATDFRAILTTVKGTRADLLFFAGLGGQGSMFVKQARQLGFTGTLMSGATFANNPFLKLTGGAAEGMLAFEQGGQLDKVASGKAFLDRFRAKYNADPIGFASFSYDCVSVIVNAMKLADSTDPKVFGPVIKNLSFDGVLGRITFDSNGDLQNAKTTLFKAEKGTWIAVETTSR